MTDMAPTAGSTSENVPTVPGGVDVVAEFNRWMKNQPNIAIAVAAIQALTAVVKRSSANTMIELLIELKAAADRLKSSHHARSIPLTAGCELFNRYVTRASLDIPRFEQCKLRLIERGNSFAQMSLTSRKAISKFADRFIRNGQVILVHGFSRVVNAVLLSAARRGKNFSVVATEGRPDGAGYRTSNELISAGVPVTLVLDSAVGYVMERVDLVLSGAEGVVENGGVVNKVGTYQVAVVAKALHKPFYVAAESYKFARLFPLNQQDLIREEAKSSGGVDAPRDVPLQPLVGQDGSPITVHPQLKVENPAVDYTPPQFITLLFTDLGILTPSAISDELIKLYY